LNGERNGKGKEYNSINGRLIFEGEYFKGKRWTGKEYDDKGNIICELYKGKGLVKDFSISSIKYKGEYFNGKRHGKGKEYEINQLIYEGEYSNGKRNGKGKEYNSINGKLLFEGEFCNNHIRKGKEFIEGILAFVGEFIHERRWNGKGYDNNGNIIYELKNGQGLVKGFPISGITFESEIYNGRRIGKGKEYDENGQLIFEGEYLNKKRWNGKRYGRNYVNDEYLGNKLILIIEGEYIEGKVNGKGEEYNGNGQLIFEGEYLNGERWKGKGYIYDDYRKRLLFEGEYLNGKKNGKGKEYNKYGGLVYEGEYLNGERNGKGKEYESFQGKLVFEGEYLKEKNGMEKELNLFFLIPWFLKSNL